MPDKLPKHMRSNIDHITELPFEIIKCPSCSILYQRMWIDRLEDHCPKCLNQHMLERETDETNI
jgi:phage FluMu protein Com